MSGITVSPNRNDTYEVNKKWGSVIAANDDFGVSSNFDGSPLMRDDESMLLYDDGSDARAHRLGSLVSGDALSESDDSSSFEWNWETDPEFSKIGFESNFVVSKEFGFADAMLTPWGIGGVETLAHFASSGFGSMVGGALATGAGLSVEALDVVNRAFGWDEYNVSADRLVETIDFFRDAFTYEPRTEIGKLMSYGSEAYMSIGSAPFNSLKTGLGDFGYEWGGSFGPLLGAGLYALPDAALLYAGARLSSPASASGSIFDDSLVTANAESFLDTKVTLQGVVDRAVMDLQANPGLARDLMSPGSYQHLAEGTRLADASYGKAVERLTARYIQEDELLSGALQYQSRPFVSTPDFFGYEGYNLRLLEITTEKSIPSHVVRSYGSAAEYVLHPGLPKDLVFPQ